MNFSFHVRITGNRGSVSLSMTFKNSLNEDVVCLGLHISVDEQEGPGDTT